MSGAPKVVVRAVEAGVRPVRLRLPFRFGAMTLEACPQLFVRATVAVEGRGEHLGYAAEMMVPRWFDKRTGGSSVDDVRGLADSMARARDAYVGDTPGTPFGLFARHCEPLAAAGAGAGATSLTSAFGAAVLDRAVVDAACRALGASFFAFAAGNGFGLAEHGLMADMDGFDWNGWLADRQPQTSIDARHTIGLLDPLGDDGAGGGDGLPVGLAAVIRRYGHRWFKIKFGGDPVADAARLADILAVLEATVPDHRYTIDGNEQYRDASALADLFERIARLPAVRRRPEAMRCIEQAVPRDASFRRALPEAPAPWLMDEADGSFAAFVEGAPLGWRGVSSKSCKGIYKAIVNRARCDVWNDAARRDGRPGGYFMTGEDLTCQAGLSVQQDLALVALLGLGHSERNGHHYGGGFGTAPAAEQDAFLAAHPDLYDRRSGAPRLAISDGRIAIGSLFAPGFAHATDPDWTVLAPLDAAPSMV